jgi:hypothetical protein
VETTGSLAKTTGTDSDGRAYDVVADEPFCRQLNATWMQHEMQLRMIQK